MSDSENTQGDESGGFGCWAIMFIAVIVILVVIVGFLMLV